jgi:hypothetical protein
MLMGVVVICGATATVNGLFLYLGQTVRDLARQGLLPPLRGETMHRLASILTAVTIGILMMTGLAGDDNLAVYYRGALLLWVLLLAVRCLAMACLPPFGSMYSIIAVAAGCTMAITGIILIYTADYSRDLLIFLLLALAGGVLLVMIWPALTSLLPQLKKQAEKEKV